MEALQQFVMQNVALSAAAFVFLTVALMVAYTQPGFVMYVSENAGGVEQAHIDWQRVAAVSAAATAAWYFWPNIRAWAGSLQA